MSHKSTRILLIEDNPGNVRLIREMLAEVEYAGFELEHVDRLSEGIERLDQKLFDVVLLDLSLPDSQEMKTLMRLYTEAPEVPIVVLSSIDDESTRIKAIRQGAQDYLVKDKLDNEVLVRSLRYAIERYRSARDLQRFSQELVSSETRFRDIIEKNADGMVIVGGDGIVMFVNPEAERLLGREAQDFVGMEFGFPVTAGKPTEIAIVRKDAPAVTAEMRAADIKWKGERACLVSLRNVTENRRAREELKSSHEKLQKIMGGTVHAMAKMLEMRDPYTAGHQQRVARLACAIAEEMGLPQERVKGIHVAGTLHDVGKIYVPAEILSKPGRITDVEFKIIKTHSRFGYDILKEIEFPWPLAEIVIQHHERLDGSGYPQCLSGDSILIEARIIGVADVVEAMTSHRPYRPALGIEKALDEISRRKGTAYDSDAADVCMRLFTEKGFKF